MKAPHHAYSLSFMAKNAGILRIDIHHPAVEKALNYNAHIILQCLKTRKKEDYDWNREIIDNVLALPPDEQIAAVKSHKWLNFSPLPPIERRLIATARWLLQENFKVCDGDRLAPTIRDFIWVRGCFYTAVLLWTILEVNRWQSGAPYKYNNRIVFDRNLWHFYVQQRGSSEDNRYDPLFIMTGGCLAEGENLESYPDIVVMMDRHTRQDSPEERRANLKWAMEIMKLIH